MDIKLIALDLDRTTLNAKGKISKINRQAIMDAMEAGVHVCIASGRAFDTLPEDVVSIPGIEYAITSNGAAIYQIKGKRLLKSYLLTPQSVDIILEMSKGYPVTYEAFIDGIAYASEEYIKNPMKFGATPQGVIYVQSTRKPVADIVSFIRDNKEHLDSIDIVVNGNELKEELRTKIAAATSEVYQTSSVKQLLEIAHCNAGKKSGVEFLVHHLGIERNQTAAFGDADNDIDMIEYAGCGIAMENATANLMKVADYVTLHHDKDGVAYGFRNILKIIE